MYIEISARQTGKTTRLVNQIIQDFRDRFISPATPAHIITCNTNMYKHILEKYPHIKELVKIGVVDRVTNALTFVDENLKQEKKLVNFMLTNLLLLIRQIKLF